jgi:di/tricarboxylate transporter
MAWEAWVTLGVIVVMVGVLLSERVAPAVCVGVAVVSLYVVGVVEFAAAFSGFSNSAPITVAALYVVAGAAEQTGALSRVLSSVLGSRVPASERGAVFRVARVAAGGSGFVPNTPLVALMIPTVEQWSRRHGLSASRLLMPLSFAAVLGGVITLIGTSTNLIVSGLLDDAGLEPFGVFSITPVGLPVAVVGVAVLVLLSPILLRRRTTPGEDLPSNREYTIDMVVTARSPLCGSSVDESGLRELAGVVLTEIERLGEIISPIDGSEVLEAGDHLIFAGRLDRVRDLKEIDGLVTTHEQLSDQGDTDLSHLFEVVVAGSGPLAGHTLKELGFRERHGAVVIAIHRAGERVGGQLGEARLRGGDVLVVVAEDAFRARTRDLPDFLVVAPMEESPPIRRPGGRIVQMVVVALVLSTGTGLVDLPKASLAAALALVVLGVMSPTEARRAVNFNVIALVAFSFGLGAAAASSGLAAAVAERLVSLGEPFGAVGILVAVMLSTLILTELLTNNAAAALMFPVAAVTAAQTGVDLRALAVGVLVMASCSFLSPIGYQTNTMVWSIGGYRFTDFTRLGIPLTCAVFVTTAAVIPLAFPLTS